MVLFIYLFLLAAVGLIFAGLFMPKRELSSHTKLPEEASLAVKKIRTRSFLSSIFPFSQKALEKFKLDIKIKNKLDASHLRLSPSEFFNLKLLLMILLVILVIFGLGKFEPLALLAALASGYFIPELYVKRKLAQRKYKIVRMLPETVDLLGLCIEAGLDFTLAMRWVIEKSTPSPIIEELSFILEEIKWGKPRSRALKDMAKRLNIPEISSFVQTLVQAERMGTPVAEAFAILSEDSRLQRFHRGERFAMQAPMKILIPLIFCILPVIGIVIAGPILLQFMQGNLLGGFAR